MKQGWLTCSSVLLSACVAGGTPSPAPLSKGAVAQDCPSPPPVAATTSPAQSAMEDEAPWWISLKPGVYAYQGQAHLLVVGQSTGHHHAAEGFLTAKVRAHMSLKRLGEKTAHGGKQTQPHLLDFYITRQQQYFVLFEQKITPAETIELLSLPGSNSAATIRHRHREGRHIYRGAEHLYLECEVEGPIANPDWGRNRASAALDRPTPLRSARDSLKKDTYVRSQS